MMIEQAFPNLFASLKGDNNNFFLLAGPCVVENYEVCAEVAAKVVDICKKYDIKYVFKASYRKANRSKSSSFAGLGDDEALAILQRIKKEFNIPIVTDIHETDEVEMVAQIADVLQIPAFLSRQTALLKAAAKTGRVVNIKKGQFASPESMEHAVLKVKEIGNQQVMLTDRGVTFGYHDLLVDYRGIPTMQAFGVPVVMDCTHSLQQPNQTSGVTGGLPHLIPTIAKAAIAVGVDGLFIETHPNPSMALSDGANMLPLSEMEKLMQQLTQIRQVVKGF